MSTEEEKIVPIATANTNGGQQDNEIVSVTSGNTKAIVSVEPLQIQGHFKTIEQINSEQRRIFLNSTITEDSEKVPPETKVESEPEVEPKPAPAPETTAETTTEEPKATKPPPPTTLALNVKYATLPSPTTATTLRSPLSPPPPKPPMLSRTRSTGSGDGRTPPLVNGNTTVAGITASASASPTLLRQSIAEATPTQEEGASDANLTISVRHYEGLIEELRCPGCAGAMKAPVLLCKSGHSVCEQCTRILLMCPLCKESFTNSRSLTVEALCAKAHFRCNNAPGGCMVRMPVALLPWHEQQCIYKPMKCFMGRVWGDCKWQGREIQWKEHLEKEHTDKLFRSPSSNLIWNMSQRRKPLTGYYVFEAFDEMFNFYEIYDKTRILFTMTCTSNRRESKYNYAYEVTLLQPDNEALSLTQKFPVHSEYDRDILMEGTCVSIGLTELSRFIDPEKQVLHYRVGVLAVKSPRRIVTKPARQSQSLNMEYKPLQNAGVNGKSIPTSMIITRTFKEAVAEVQQAAKNEPSTPDSTGDDNASQELERKWGTPQLHFNRKYLRNTWTEGQQQEDELGPLASDLSPNGRQDNGEDKLSLCSNTTSYTKKVSDTLRKSFRALKTDIIELRPFHKNKNTKAVTATPVGTTGTAAGSGAGT
ncbi:uncharacterized protein [Drosophila tropicalis]|uniref:uncharacterized protein n=1 Tax=Drosophila tropicalis TaxID=46794 RepID=UPI0035AB90ED